MWFQIYKYMGIATVPWFYLMAAINFFGMKAPGSAVVNFGIATLYLGLYVFIITMGWK